MTVNDAYDLLGLQPGASPDALKEAYRRMSKKVHPDQGGSAALFRQVQEAYDLLSKPQSGTANNTNGEAAQRAEEERRKEAERQQREEMERRKAENSPPADAVDVELAYYQADEMRESVGGVTSKLAPNQNQNFSDRLDPLHRVLKAAFEGHRKMSKYEFDQIQAKLDDLWEAIFGKKIVP